MHVFTQLIRDLNGTVSHKGVTKRCRLSWLANIAPSYIAQMRVEGGELRGFSQSVLLYTRAQINFGDLTLYLTHGLTRIAWAAESGTRTWERSRLLPHVSLHVLEFFLPNFVSTFNSFTQCAMWPSGLPPVFKISDLLLPNTCLFYN